MIKNNILLLIFCTFFTYNIGHGQTTDLALGQWKAHLPFKNGLHVAQSNTDVYFTTMEAVLRLSKDGTEREKLTKVEGLSTVGVRMIGYNKEGGVLIVVYNSGVIDLLSDEGILTILNIPQSEIILGEKIIYDMFMANDSIAYLASNFGISKLNVHTGKFPSTTKTPLPIESISIYNNALYAGTAEGVYTATLDGSINTDDFNNWTYLDATQGFPEEYSTRSLATFEQNLYLEVNDSLYVFDGNTASFVDYREENVLAFLTSEGKHLLIGYRNDLSLNESRVVLFDGTSIVAETGGGCSQNIRYAVEDESGSVWVADQFSNYRQWLQNGGCNFIEINSPLSSNVTEIQIANDQVWIAAGGIDLSNNSGLGVPDGVFSLIDGDWQEYNKFEVLRNVGNGLWEDFNTIAIHPANGKVYAGSYSNGIAVFDNEGNYETFYNDTTTNFVLQEGVGSPNTRIGGLAFDDENNLWISNSRANSPISVLKNDGTWQSFSLPCTPDKTTRNMAIDAFGYKWFALMNTSLGILVFDEGDMNDPSDDRCKVITSSNSNLPTNEVRDMALDLDGNMWVGTKKGVIAFECNVLDNDCPGSLRIVDEDDFGAFLLDEEDVLSVAIDGANRKWFGTTNGIFVQSPSGEEKVARFTTDNSPLFDNNVQDIAFDHVTGEVYIGTNGGVQVYRSDATAGGVVHDSDVVVFPNPVRPEYTGQIAIKGLAEDADVKITDVNGLLVYETTALGGQAIWDGKDYTGRKANTGVYIVFSTSKTVSNPNTAVAKILFIN